MFFFVEKKTGPDPSKTERDKDHLVYKRQQQQQQQCVILVRHSFSRPCEQLLLVSLWPHVKLLIGGGQSSKQHRIPHALGIDHAEDTQGGSGGGHTRRGQGTRVRALYSFSSSSALPLASSTITAMGERDSPSSCLFVSDLPSDITEKVSPTEALRSAPCAS